MQRVPIATLNYLEPQAGPLHTYAFDPPGGGPRFNGRLRAHEVAIADARQSPAAGRGDRPARAWLAERGFALVAHRSAMRDVRDFWDEAELRRTAYPEAEALVRELTGARRARAFDHTLRRRAAHKPPLDGLGGSFAAVREPVGRVHADYTPCSAPLRVRQVLAGGPHPAGEAAIADVLASRFLIVGLWRPLLAEPLQDAPLALADARSVARSDLVPNDLVYADRRGQTYAVLHNPAHRWHCVARQTRDEVIACVHYDSATATQAITGAAPHSAFIDPGAPADAPPRESLEMRVLAW